MAAPAEINQLILVIVSGFQAGELMQHLTRNRFYFTKIDSSGGVFQEPTVVLLIGLNKSNLAPLLEIVREDCQPHPQYIPAHVNVQPGSAPFPMIEAQVGGALIYLMNVDKFTQIN